MEDRKPSKAIKFLIIFLITLWLFFFIGLPLLLTGVMNKQRGKCTASAQGKVVDFAEDVFDPGTDEHGRSQRTTVYAPVVTFTTQDGKEYTSTSRSYDPGSRCRVGDTVRVLYDPNDPSNIFLPDHDKKDNSLALGALFPAASAAFIIIFLKTRRTPDPDF